MYGSIASMPPRSLMSGSDSAPGVVSPERRRMAQSTRVVYPSVSTAAAIRTVTGLAKWSGVSGVGCEEKDMTLLWPQDQVGVQGLCAREVQLHNTSGLTRTIMLRAMSTPVRV